MYYGAHSNSEQSTGEEDDDKMHITTELLGNKKALRAAKPECFL